MRIPSNLTLIRAGAIAAIGLMGFALSSQYAFAQATYNYTGRAPMILEYPPFTTTSMHVSATLQLGSWLPPNQRCIYVSSLPGFRLIMSDGLNTYDTDLLSPSAALAMVSTDSQGQITAPWRISLGDSRGSVSSNFVPTCTPLLDEYDTVLNATGEYRGIPGGWSYPDASALTIMLTNEINVQQIGPGKSLSNKLTQIRNDITTNNGYACSDLANFTSAVQAQTGKKITADQSTFILHTVTIMQSELSCGG